MQNFRARRAKLRKTNVKLKFSIFYVLIFFFKFDRYLFLFVLIFSVLTPAQTKTASRASDPSQRPTV